jgi:hypothetical protein
MLLTMDPNLWGHTTVTFNTDGIHFIAHNSATCIITNKCYLFVQNLTLAQVQVNTIDASAKKLDTKVQFALNLSMTRT